MYNNYYNECVRVPPNCNTADLSTRCLEVLLCIAGRAVSLGADLALLVLLSASGGGISEDRLITDLDERSKGLYEGKKEKKRQTSSMSRY